MKKIIILFAILMPILAVAQNTEVDTLTLFTKLSNEGMMLKIIPSKAQTWLLGAENGYVISRKEIGRDMDFKVLNNKPLKPFSKSQYKNLANGDSIMILQQKAIFNNISKNSQSMSYVDRIQFVDNLQKEYGFYILVSTRIKGISQSSGMEFLDKSAKPGRTYLYKVEIAGDNNLQHSTVKLVNYLDFDLGIPNINPQEGDKGIRINWMHSKVDYPILCYFVEKSEDNKSFVRITEAPIYANHLLNEVDTINNSGYSEMFYFDSLAQNYKPFYYRLVGVDVWANEHISKDVVKAMGRDLTPPDPVEVISFSTNDSIKSITYNWVYTPETDFAGFQLYTSDKFRGNYELVEDKLFAKETRSYTFEKVEEATAKYFRIATVDTAGNTSFSNPKFSTLRDLYPPATPTGLKASIDTSGILFIQWDKNTEKDIRGYKVLTTNKIDGKLIAPKTEMIVDTFIIDTINLKSLLKFKYFSLVAIDYNFNVSERSPIIKVKLPDIVGPSSGKITKIEVNKSSANIHWLPSVSKDVMSQNVLRRIDGSKEWKTVATLSNTATNYTDNNIAQGSYEYSVMAIDSSENAGSKSVVYAIEIKAEPENIVIEDFKAKKNNGKAELSWKSSGSEAKFYIIYREDKKGNLKAIASVTENKFSDKLVKNGRTYKYYIVAQGVNGVLFSRSKVEKVGF